MYGYIYKTTYLKTNLIYVGKHKAKKFEPEKYLGSGTILRSIIKHERKLDPVNYKQCFKQELIECCETEAVLNAREEFWVEAFDARNPAVGYNILKGGRGACHYGEANGIYGTHRPQHVKDAISKRAKGTIWINNGIEQHTIKPEDLARYPDWQRGMLPKRKTDKLTAAHEKQKGAKSMYKDGVYIKVLAPEIESYLADGWVLKGKISEASLEGGKATRWQKGHATHSKGKIWITDGTINKYIFPDDLDKFPGFYRGCIQNRKAKRTKAKT